MSRAFEALYDAHAAYVVRSLRRLGVREADLFDEAQNVFVAVFRQLDSFDVSRPIKPWLFGFCYRIAANYRRLARNRYTADELPKGAESADASPEQSMQRSEARDMVLLGLEALDEQQRAIFCMYELDGCTAPEIGEALELSAEQIYVQIKTARRRFRAALAKRGLP